jgi:integrase
MLPGVHKVRVRLATGRAEYWYAWRGGPRILACKAKTAEDLARMVDAAAPAAIAQFKVLVQPPSADAFVSGLITKFLDSPAYLGLGATRRSDLSRYLDAARTGVGTMPLEALASAGTRKVLLDWRDKFKATPCTADNRLGALAQVLAWAKKDGLITVNPLEEWPRIYKVDRADIIWTKPDLIRLLTGADADFRRAVLLAAFTGLRLGDLVKVTWANVGKDAITLATSKSNGKRVVVIPITPKTRAILKQIGRKDVGTVLTHSRGKPWTGWGLQTAMQRAKNRPGQDIEGLRFHDLRGTAATHFIRAGLPMADVATIMGWAPAQVEAIARRYVTSEAVAAGMLERLRKNKGGARL